MSTRFLSVTEAIAIYEQPDFGAAHIDDCEIKGTVAVLDEGESTASRGRSNDGESHSQWVLC